MRTAMIAINSAWAGWEAGIAYHANPLFWYAAAANTAVVILLIALLGADGRYRWRR
jgi:hypothetical protein